MSEACGHPWFWSIVGFWSGALIGATLIHLEWWRQKIERRVGGA